MKNDALPSLMPGPAGTDRRTFLKQAVAGGVCATAALSGCMRLASQDAEGTTLRFLGAHVVVGSPAPVGVPLMRVAIDDDGHPVGLPENLEAQRFCGQEHAPDLWAGEGVPGRTDRFWFDIPSYRDEHLEANDAWPWYAEHRDEVVHLDHFADKPPLTGASVRWRVARSDSTDPSRIPTFLLLKLDPDTVQGAARDDVFANDHGLVAFSDMCTHFCCRNTWHEEEVARKFDAWDTMFCTCHNARFDPMRLETYTVTRGADHWHIRDEVRKRRSQD